MTMFQALLLGLVQGVTEFLPISSSGHLVIFPELLGWSLQDVAFDAVIHLATLFVVLIYFRRDLVEILRTFKISRQPARTNEIVQSGGARDDKQQALFFSAWMIVLATIPVGAFGLMLEKIDGLRTLPVIIITTFVWGIVLMVADRFAEKKGNGKSKMEEVGWKRTLLIGLSQMLALIPGTSRSGITITTGLFAGLNRETATRMAFLVGVPAIALAGGAKLLDIVSGTVPMDPWVLTVGFLSAFVSGYASVYWLMKILRRVGFYWFGVYRILLATFLFLLWLK